MAANGDGRNAAEIFDGYRKDAYSHTSAESVPSFYNTWAQRYNQVNLGGGYKAAVELATVVSEVIGDKSSRILDAASGTGLVGEEVKGVHVYHPIAKVRCRKAGHYSAVVMAGAFGIPGHVDETCFLELIRITKPGGYIMFTVSDKVFEQVERKMKAAISAHSQQGRWEIVEYRKIQYYLNETLDEKAQVPVLRVLPK